MEERFKRAKEEKNKIENENTKLMWKYASLFWKIIIVLGCISLFYACWIIGSNLNRILG